MITLNPAPSSVASVQLSPASGRTAIRQTVTIEPVRSRSQRHDFVDFPWQIYQGDRAWCPPLKIEAHTAINPKKHPFYQHGSAVQFLARQDGKVVGRISVSDDPRYNAEHSTPDQQTNVGCFGMFESINDPEVARTLLNAAARWLRGRGRTSIIGPGSDGQAWQSGSISRSSLAAGRRNTTSAS